MITRIKKLESLMGPLVFALMLIVFLLSPVRQVTDSRYSMLLTQSLLDHGSFRLDHYALPRHQPEWDQTYFRHGDYRLEASRGHVYYYLPPGSSVLSVPFVALLNLFGLSAVGDDNAYDHQGEVQIEAILAAFLMAALSCLFFYTARLILPTKWSVFVALGGALGTQVYSTASRALWSHTWGILLLGIVVFLLLRLEARQRGLTPVLLASLLSWLYFIRPTFAVSILAVTVYFFLFQRRLFPRYAVTGTLWLMVFALYSWTHFGQLLPSYYYLASRFAPDHFREALAANLISPSRGLLIYVPILLFVAFLLVRHRRQLVHRRLVWLSLIIITADVLVVSVFPVWWAGHCFGPRFLTGSVPWFVLLGTLGLRASLTWRGERASNSLAGWRAQFAFGAALLVSSVFINANGAIHQATWEWNEGPPLDVDLYPARAWDWRQPQFLAMYLPTPRRAYSWQGWSGANAGCREVKHGDPSAAFFLSIEFQENGYLAYLMRKAAYGDIPGTPVPVRLADFLQDMSELRQEVVVGQDGWQQKLEVNKRAFAAGFTSRPEFAAAYPQSITPEGFTDALNANSGGALSQAERDALVSELKNGVKTRAQVLKAVAEDADMRQQEFNRAFVLMLYFAYLRRDPDTGPETDFGGYNFWLNKLNESGGDQRRAEMARAFIQSVEYRKRCGQ
ncbi:MAG TPA: DUF4214 domain-containing protein [Pyrinomonadaceae bacterium]|nr:DUF4214 domain-containing protein [Pyrinomonadaceae bacterium]